MCEIEKQDSIFLSVIVITCNTHYSTCHTVTEGQGVMPNEERNKIEEGEC